MLIGIIGGSGFYKLADFESAKKEIIKTPFGDVELFFGKIEGKNVVFLPRHKEGHRIPPHMINYRANIYALYEVGVDYIISTNAVGSMRKELQPGKIVFPDQIIDLTKNRTYTFFDGEFEIKLRNGKIKKGVVHTDVTEPYCNELRKIFIEVAQDLNLDFAEKGVYVCAEGPRFETPAEINFFKIIGGDIVGMTSSPEVFLAKELEICYATICVVTNYAAGMQERVSHEEVIKIFNKVSPKIFNIICETVVRLSERR